MKKALTGPDIGQLVQGWQTLIGSRVDQFGRPDLNKIVLKLRSRDKGTVRLLIDLSGWAYLTKETISTESNQGVFVQKVRKLIKKSRIESIEQINGDRTYLSATLTRALAYFKKQFQTEIGVEALRVIF